MTPKLTRHRAVMSYDLVRYDDEDNETVTRLTVSYTYHPGYRGDRIDPPEFAFAEFSVEPDIELTDEESEAIGDACMEHALGEHEAAVESYWDGVREDAR